MFTITFFQRPWGCAFNVPWTILDKVSVSEEELLMRLEQADAWASLGKQRGKGRMVLVEGLPHFKSPTRSHAAIKVLQRRAVSV